LPELFIPLFTGVPAVAFTMLDAFWAIAARKAANNFKAARTV